MAQRLKIRSDLETRAAFQPSTFDEKAGTVEVVFTTGARGLRRSWSGSYYEELEVSERAIDLSRLNNGAAVLNAHSAWDVRGVLGVVERAWISGKEGRALLRFSDREDVKPVRRDVQAGILRHVSVGYTVQRLEQIEKVEDVPVYRATRWTPAELSLVPVAFDDGATVRGRTATPEFYEVEIVTRSTKENVMDENQPTAPPPPPAPAPASPEVLAERQRVATITQLCTRHALGGLAEQLVSGGVSLDLARERILAELARRNEAFPPLQNAHIISEGDYRAYRGEPHAPVTGGGPAMPDFQRAAVDALLVRSGIPVKNPHRDAHGLSASIYDLARTCLSRAGKSSWFGNAGPQLLKRAMTTSDFPLILAGSLHASIRQGYETEPASHRAWVRAQPVVDFRDQQRPILGSAPELEKVMEGGEYKQAPMTEDSTSYKVEKFGRVVGLSWEVMVNDNLGAWLRLQPAMGQKARAKEADLVYAIFTANGGAGPAMQDGTNLFHANHGNLLAVAAAISSGGLGAGRTLLRKQTAVGGGYLSLVPRFWIVAPEWESAAEIILANASRRTTTEKDTAEWIASLQLVVEPRLPATATWLATDPNQIDTVELGLLVENEDGPVLEEEREFIRDEYRWKVRHAFGVKPLDWRGLVKMPVP